MILEQKPDIIFADSMLPYNSVAMAQLEASGIPIFISDTTTLTNSAFKLHSDRLFSCNLMLKLASIVGNQKRSRPIHQLCTVL
jgi:ABC-type Fe3+-hydroxamate transport system substrate-binding protein